MIKYCWWRIPHNWYMWGRTGGVWTPYPWGSPPLPLPNFFVPTHAPFISLFFFQGTPAQNSDFLPPTPHPSDCRPPPIFCQKKPTPAPLTPGPLSPVLPHIYELWKIWRVANCGNFGENRLTSKARSNHFLKYECQWVYWSTPHHCMQNSNVHSVLNVINIRWSQFQSASNKPLKFCLCGQLLLVSICQENWQPTLS